MSNRIGEFKIISVDDHVVEPPDLWTSRVSKKFGDRIPHVERDRIKMSYIGREMTFERGVKDGEWCDLWVYDGYQFPFTKVIAAIGFENLENDPVTFDSIHPSAWIQKDRITAMDVDHLEASMCYPNVFSRFCGQTFLERDDKELSLECVRAYNDWMLDEWCAGDGYGRLLPLTIVPLWDVELATRELRRCAEKGTLAVSFSENPYQLGLPSLHSGKWDPFFRACDELNVVLCMHIGSSSNMPSTSPDAPYIISSTLHFSVTVGSLFDFIFAGILDRFPNLKLFFAESQAGWMPFALEQADWMYERREGMTYGSSLPRKPSEYLIDRVYTSVYNDGVALRNRKEIGLDQICFETDFPHSVATYPNSLDIALKLCAEADMKPDEIHKLLRLNAIKAFSLDRVGIHP
jgi:predicted TIM-barrel fold metal-dependent hydrolase